MRSLLFTHDGWDCKQRSNTTRRTCGPGQQGDSKDRGGESNQDAPAITPGGDQEAQTVMAEMQRRHQIRDSFPPWTLNFPICKSVCTPPYSRLVGKEVGNNNYTELFGATLIYNAPSGASELLSWLSV